ncbi:hypothetical protein BDM02DRAFT_3272643 [Thelephora ganbajun]|uniref:Uncharacterized protein n=1 Tax=Thelephora ganbajun TaxID=370292 RepID=A0ACB6Z3G0_THEGA|nr:hypothetical protein BDM02DRAFT_3272643 [Thelephora ganbajun]
MSRTDVCPDPNLKDPSGQGLIAGPTVSTWDLTTVLQENWLNSLKGALKRITLERPTPDVWVAVADPIFNASHSNGAHRKRDWKIGHPSRYSLVASDYNGDATSTFIGTLRTIDYSLQLASVDYSAVYLHKMERETPSNLFDYPEEEPSYIY